MKKFRLLITERGCPHCPEVLRFINKINLKLPFENRIEVIDTIDERYNVNFFPITRKISHKGTPHLVFGRIMNGKIVEDMHITGASITELNEDFLLGYLEDEFMEDFIEDGED